MSTVITPESPTIAPQPRTYNDYSAERKAEVLALVQANNGNVLRTANECGLDESLIRLWLKKQDHYRTLSDQKLSDLADQCESNARYFLDLAREKAPDAPYNHLMTGFGIATDKMQLLRGQPTSITANIDRAELNVVLESMLVDVTPEPE